MKQSGPQSHPPIAIIFANMKGNLGDYAILHAMLVKLKHKYPGQPIHVYSHPMRKDDVARTQAFLQEAPAFEYRGPSYGSKPNSFWMMALKARLVPGGLAAVIKRLAHSWAGEFHSFSQYGAVYVAGGEQWNGRGLGALMFATLAALREKGLPVYCFPFSVKPKIAKLYSTEKIQQLFSQLHEPIVVRDEASARFLSKSGVAAKVGADSVFGLQAEVERIAPAQGRNPERILIAATGSYEHIAHVAKTLLSGGYAVEALTTCEIEDKENLERLRREFGVTYHAPLTWQNFAAELKSSRLVITNRLHGLIFSTLSKSVPFPVTDRNKVKAFVGDAQIVHHSASLLEIDGKAIAAAIAGRESTLDQVNAYARRCEALPNSPV